MAADFPIAYYNEHDPFAAAWLRELIDVEVIAHGIVDERSIEDVCPDDLEGYTQCHFFAGIGGWSYALRQAGWADDRVSRVNMFTFHRSRTSPLPSMFQSPVDMVLGEQGDTLDIDDWIDGLGWKIIL